MAVHLVNGEFVATISEAAGFKTGVALDKPQLINLFPDDSGFRDMLSMGDESVIRIHSSDIDELFMQVLYHLGNVDTPTPVSSTIRLLHKYKGDEKLHHVYMSVFELYTTHFELMMKEAEKSGSKTLNPENNLM